MSVNQEFRFRHSTAPRSSYWPHLGPRNTAHPKAVLQLVHGIAEHIGRYDRFARFMSDHGYLVWAEDHLGHGNTPENAEDLGYTADKDGWVKMTDNVRALHGAHHAPISRHPLFYPRLPMGSFLTRSYLIRYPEHRGCLRPAGHRPAAGVRAEGGTGRLPSGADPAGQTGAQQAAAKPVFLAPTTASSSPTAPNRTGCAPWMRWWTPIADPFCQVMPTVTLMRDMLTGIRFNQQTENLAKMDKTTRSFSLRRPGPGRRQRQGRARGLPVLPGRGVQSCAPEALPRRTPRNAERAQLAGRL